MYELLLICYSVNNVIDFKMSKIFVCFIIKVKIYLKMEGWVMNIIILVDYWLDMCYDVMW